MSKEGISVMPKKVEKILAWERPATIRDVRSFLGIMGYYWRFIHGYADLSCPLSRLTKKSVQWQWGIEQERSFQKLVAALTSAQFSRFQTGARIGSSIVMPAMTPSVAS